MSKQLAKRSFKFLNVIMHGVYGYALNSKDNCLHALTPALFPHVYSARNYGATQNSSTDHSVPLHGDYTLTGVRRKRTFQICAGTPSLPGESCKIKHCDYYGKRRFSLDLPFPTGDGKPKSEPYYLLESFNVGSIFQGLAASTLNNVGKSFPSLFCFVYEVDDKEELALVSNPKQPIIRAGQAKPNSIPLDFLVPHGNYANLHILAGLDPVEMSETDDHAPHARRAFASLVDLFDELPLTLQIPDGFTPQSVPVPLPKGVKKGDIGVDEGPRSLHYGHANCHSATFVIDNRPPAKLQT